MFRQGKCCIFKQSVYNDTYWSKNHEENGI